MEGVAIFPGQQWEIDAGMYEQLNVATETLSTFIKHIVDPRTGDATIELPNIYLDQATKCGLQTASVGVNSGSDTFPKEVSSEHMREGMSSTPEDRTTSKKQHWGQEATDCQWRTRFEKEMRGEMAAGFERLASILTPNTGGDKGVVSPSPPLSNGHDAD